MMKDLGTIFLAYLCLTPLVTGIDGTHGGLGPTPAGYLVMGVIIGAWLATSIAYLVVKTQRKACFSDLVC